MKLENHLGFKSPEKELQTPIGLAYTEDNALQFKYYISGRGMYITQF